MEPVGNQKTYQVIDQQLRRIRKARRLLYSSISLLLTTLLCLPIGYWVIQQEHALIYSLVLAVLWLAANLYLWHKIFQRTASLYQLARESENSLPELGWRLSTSYEVADRDQNELPQSIREAIWQDTVKLSEKVNWRVVTRPFASLTLPLISLGMIVLIATWYLTYLIFPFFSAGTESASPEKATEPAAEEKPSTFVDAHLRLDYPEQDMWATAIEAIPLEIAAESPEGFKALSVVAEINGERIEQFPLNAPSLEKGEKSVTGDIYLDELKLSAYDVVAYHVKGEAVAPSAATQTKRSRVLFVQIRPFDKEVFDMGKMELKQGGAMLPAQKLKDLITYLIEEERLVIRGSWLLREEQDRADELDSYDESYASVQESQVIVKDKLEEAYRLFTRELQEKMPAQVLVKFDEAREFAEAALQHLEQKELNEAVNAEQKALSSLVFLESFFVELVGNFEAQGKQSGKEQPKVTGLEDRQVFRVGEAKKVEDIEQLSEEMEKLYKEIQELEDFLENMPHREYQQKRDRLIAENEKIAQVLEKLAQATEQSQNTSPSEASDENTGQPKDASSPQQAQKSNAQKSSSAGKGQGSGSGSSEKTGEEQQAQNEMAANDPKNAASDTQETTAAQDGAPNTGKEASPTKQNADGTQTATASSQGAAPGNQNSGDSASSKKEKKSANASGSQSGSSDGQGASSASKPKDSSSSSPSNAQAASGSSSSPSSSPGSSSSSSSGSGGKKGTAGANSSGSSSSSSDRNTPSDSSDTDPMASSLNASARNVHEIIDNLLQMNNASQSQMQQSLAEQNAERALNLLDQARRLAAQKANREVAEYLSQSSDRLASLLSEMDKDQGLAGAQRASAEEAAERMREAAAHAPDDVVQRTLMNMADSVEKTAAEADVSPETLQMTLHSLERLRTSLVGEEQVREEMAAELESRLRQIAGLERIISNARQKKNTDEANALTPASTAWLKEQAEEAPLLAAKIKVMTNQSEISDAIREHGQASSAQPNKDQKGDAEQNLQNSWETIAAWKALYETAQRELTRRASPLDQLDQLQSMRADQAPEKFKEAVKDYYRNLSRLEENTAK